MNTQYKGSMPKELKKKWLKELRSGEWIQTSGTLHDPKTGGFCCLGVLQYIASGGYCETQEDDSTVFRGMPTPSWLRANSCHFYTADAVGRATLNVLAIMNDDYVVRTRSPGSKLPDSGNFAEIADWIEAHIEGV